jgi:hypothetical protein
MMVPHVHIVKIGRVSDAEASFRWTLGGLYDNAKLRTVRRSNAE